MTIAIGMSIPFFSMTDCVAQDSSESSREKFRHRVEEHLYKSARGQIKAELGSFDVPENHAKPGGKKIRLKYVRLPAINETKRSPIVFLAGGPGGSGIQTGKGNRWIAFNALREISEVILLDQRGTGISNPLPVGESWAIAVDKPATEESTRKAVIEAFDKSLTKWEAAGIDLSVYNTISSADDLAILCQVLGAKKINLLGSSYGTHLSFCFMRRHPGLVDRVVLTGLEGPDHTLKMPADQQALLKQIQLWIDADEEIKEQFPDLIGQAERVLARLEKEPKQLTTGSGKTRVITAFDVRRLLASMLRGPASISSIPRAIQAMDEDKFGLMALYHSRLRSGSIRAMPTAMDVASGASRKRLALIKEQCEETLLGDAINFPINVIIDHKRDWDLGEEFRSELETDIHVLAISGTADGRTPPSNAVELLKKMPNGKHLLIQNAGHGEPLMIGSKEILDRMKAFYRHQEVEIAPIKLSPVKFWK